MIYWNVRNRTLSERPILVEIKCLFLLYTSRNKIFIFRMSKVNIMISLNIRLPLYSMYFIFILHDVLLIVYS